MIPLVGDPLDIRAHLRMWHPYVDLIRRNQRWALAIYTKTHEWSWAEINRPLGERTRDYINELCLDLYGEAAMHGGPMNDPWRTPEEDDDDGS